MLAYGPLPLRPRCCAAQQAPAPAPAPPAAAAAASASPAELELPYDAWRLVLDGEVVCAPLPAALLRGYAAKLKVTPEGRSTKFSLDDLSVAGIPPAAYPHKYEKSVLLPSCLSVLLSRKRASLAREQRSLETCNFYFLGRRYDTKGHTVWMTAKQLLKAIKFGI